MRKSSREPSLLKDVGALAGLYVDLFRMMEKRATGHSLIVKYTPPDRMADLVREEKEEPERELERTGTGC